MINITFCDTSSDATSRYLVDISPMCVGDFIEEWLKEHPNEWGYFGINDGKTIYGSPQWFYQYGQLKTKVSDEYLGKRIRSVSGSGGWSRSDFLFVLEKGESE